MSRSIYLYHTAEGGYENYLVGKERDDDTLRFLTGAPLGADWKGAKIRYADSGRAPSDFPSFIGATPLFSERAWEALAGRLGSFVEALPVANHKQRAFYAINVLAVYEGVFDPENSRFAYNEYAKSISAVYEYAFKNLARVRSPIFKVKETSWIDTYVTQEFLDLVTASQLVGLEGIPIYSV